MTTYSGRGASYIPGREVVNKEPPVSRYVVEKLYRVHRERVMKVEKTIDTHIVIPDFLLNREWKKNSERQKQKVILQENQEIYKRIAKLEDAEGHITKENKEHRKRMSLKLDYLRKLKEHGRLVNLIKIQKENEYMLKRLEKAKPQYTLKKCKDWYKHHELYKMGRRSDPTAGHIMHGMRELLPSSLPPLSTVTTKLDDETLTTLLDSKRSKRKQLPSLEGSSISQSLASNSVLSLSSVDRRNSSLSKSAPNLNVSDSNSVATRKFSQQYNNGMSRKESRVLTLIEESDEADSPKRRAGSIAGSEYNQTVDSRLSCRSFDGSEDGGSEADYSMATNPFNHEVQVSPQHFVHIDDMILLASRPFPLPTESKNCLVQIYCSREYDENLRIVVLPPGGTAGLEKLAERVITIDHAYDLVHASGHSSQLMHSTDQDDLQTLSDFLINMFKEADVDGSGSLTFDEFQVLMEQVELGISPQELRFVISEADENENGVVDYEEFVPLAVDLIQSFRARNRAKTISSQQDVLVDDQILQTISSSELALAAKVCLEKLTEFDKKNYGLVRVSEFKRCLSAIAPSVGLLESEINLLSQLLPRDQFNRLKYNSTPTSFYDHLSKVRFMTMKNAMIESQGSGLQKYLLELCKEEEKKNDEENMKNSRGGDLKTAPPGYIPCRSLISILTNSPRLSLSRLQVLVIMSEASVLDGYISYYQFIPVVTKAIELMFEPKALRQRAELIARTDLSPEALLQGMGMSQEAFEDRLLTLFKSYDIDHNGTLDQNEFIACLESLELQLTKGEMVALMASADVAQHGFLGFEDFVKFFSHNLLHLEREKRIRLLQSSMDLQQQQNQQNQQDGEELGDDRSCDSHHSHQGSLSHSSSSIQQLDMGQQLLSIFELSDPNKTGFITYEDFESILKDFSMHSSPFLMDLLRSELHTSAVDTGDGQGEQMVLVEYRKSLATCADLFSVYRAKESAWVEHHVKEEEAGKRAQQIAMTQVADIQRICRYLLRRMKVMIPSKLTDFSNDVNSVASVETHVVESTVFLLSKANYADLQAIVRAPQAGLSRSEANIVLHRLLGPSFGLSVAATGSEDADGVNLTLVTDNDNDNDNTGSNSLPTSAKRSNNPSPRHLHLQRSITDRAVSLDQHPATLAVTAVSPLSSAARQRQQQQQQLQLQLQQLTSRDVFDAVFEARKTTIMRTLLQPIDHSALQQRVYQALEAVWLKDNNKDNNDNDNKDNDNDTNNNNDDDDSQLDPDAPRDVYGHLLPTAKEQRRRQKRQKQAQTAGAKYLSVDRCYAALETLSGLPVSRAQLMFVIAAADCYDKASGSLLDIYRLSEHIGQVSSQLVGAENIATRGAVVTQGKVDDRKALHGLKDTQLLRHLLKQLVPGESNGNSPVPDTSCDTSVSRQPLPLLDTSSSSVSQDNDSDLNFTVNQLVQVLRDTQRLQLTDRDINTILAVCGLLNLPRDEPLRLHLLQQQQQQQHQPAAHSYHNNNNNNSNAMTAEKLLAAVVECVVALCRERMIHRRLSLCHQPTNAAAECVTTTNNSNSNTANAVSLALHEDSRKTLKQLAEKLLYVVKLLPADSVSPEDARRFSGLDTAEYFYPLRVGLPGDARLLRQISTGDDDTSPLYAGHRKHHHVLHRFHDRRENNNNNNNNNNSKERNGQKKTQQRLLSLTAADCVAAVSVTDLSDVVVGDDDTAVSRQQKDTAVGSEDTGVAVTTDSDTVDVRHSTNNNNDLTATQRSTADSFGGYTVTFEDDDFEDDPDVSLLVLFKGAIFLPAKIPIVTVGNSNSSSNMKPSASRKTNTDVSSLHINTVDSVDAGDEVRSMSASASSSSFSRRFQQQVQQGSALGRATPQHKQQQLLQLQLQQQQQQQFRTVRKGVLLQIVAVDRGGGLSLYSTQGSGLVAQVMSPDGSIAVPCANLPLRLPSVGAVDKEAAEQFVANVLDRLYLEQSLPFHLQQQQSQAEKRTPMALSVGRAPSSANLNASTTTTTLALSETHSNHHNGAEITWSLKLRDDEEV